MPETIKIVVALLIALRPDDVSWGFHCRPVVNPPELPSSSSPLRVASTTWATSNDGVGIISAGGTAAEEGGGVSSSSSSSSSWSLGRYDARGVALKLRALGADVDASIAAGDAVQDYVLARVARRRIRRFLRERDAMWESGRTAPLLLLPLDRRRDDDDDDVDVRTTSSATAGAASSPGGGGEGSGSPDLDDVLGVMTEYGLTGNDISAVLAHTPGVVMMRARMTEDEALIDATDGERESFSLEETLDRAFVGLLGDTLKLRRYDARKVLRATAGLLTSRGSSSAVQVVRLMIALGSSASSIARDKSSLPTLLRRSPALMFRLVAFLSSAQLRVPLSAIGPILRQRQSAELLDAVAPVGRPPAAPYARDDDDDAAASGTNSTAESEIMAYPKSDSAIRQRRIEESYRTMEGVADALRRSAGIRDFRKILSSHPGVFFLNVTNIHLITHFLRDDVGMTRDDIAKVIQAFPTLLEQDVSRMGKVVEFLISIDVDEADDLPSILRSFPTTLLLDVERDMMPVVSFLRDIGVRNIGRFVTRIPPVLGYSVDDDMRPKWDFLREVCQFDYFEVVRFPAYFSYPLERVIKMRYEYLRDCKGIPIQLARVDDVLRFGDRDFATEIALDDDDGVAYAKFVEERSCSHGGRRKKLK
ncbi:hypothetical protein ACHAW5_001868 [Stephanodiscus triporus]|uniref:mTERF domain-containing protein, mitochondrial n=1 Tax=Stephanodiscus triporus TaxID=2934178 RepID=A0ABD3NYQ8_9STRA